MHQSLLFDQKIKQLCKIAIIGLGRFYNNSKELPYSGNIRCKDGWKSTGFSLRYAAISQIGIAEWLKFHPNDRVGLPDLWPRILDNEDKIKNIGDFALLLWAAVESGRDDCDRFAKMLVQHWPVGQQMCNSVEPAWVVQSLVHLSEVADLSENSRTVLNAAHDKLLSLYNPASRLFARHNRSGLTERLSRRIACFADQVYPIIALSNYGRYFSDSQSSNAAVAATDTICQLQGPQGQWWWHYDTNKGHVCEEYPVFSVHQASMAPMAIKASDKASGLNHFDKIKSGLEWNYGNNELGENLVLPEQGIIWRDIERRELPKISRFSRGLCCVYGLNGLHRRLGKSLFGFKINYECRPYELGWILYAWADYKPEIHEGKA